MMPLLVVIFLALLHSTKSTGYEYDPYIIKTKSLPTDLNFMPTLCNGHLGFTVYGDAIFMNGLYNGRAGDSRRARIPNWLNVSLSNGQGSESSSYELHMRDGYFRTLQTTGDVSVEQRFYPHRFYTRALIYELRVERTEALDPLIFNLDVKPGRPSEAMNFTDEEHFIIKGKTLITEHEKFQQETREVFIAFSESLKERKILKMAPGVKELYYRYVLTIDESKEVARKEMMNVFATDEESLLKLHCREWRKFWHDFHIDVEGNMELGHTINAAIFYLANSLPSLSSNQPNLPYFGLSPTGLGRGNLDDDYEGHNFWDTEIWMLPVVTQLAPNWTKALFQYRLQHLAGAEFNAKETGYEGARFPWESAFTGTEVTNPCCPKVAEYQVHISADIAFALQQFYATTNDREWLCATAWPLVEKIVAFLTSRVEADPVSEVYHIKAVMGPDEDHWNVTDNVYTNFVFKQALEFASFTQLQCRPESTPNPMWQRIAQHLVILYDPLLDYHPQHLGYQPQTQIKQADTVLLGFPLQLPMNASTQLHDLDTYAQVTRASGPAMTWSMFAINYLDVENTEKAGYYFEKCFQDYVRPEFKVWSEVKLGFVGSANFLTGIGGFLQAIIHGYGGIRYHRQNASNTMEIRTTHLLPQTTRLTIHGIKFANATFKLHIKHPLSTLSCLSFGTNKLKLEMGGKSFTLYEGFQTPLSSTAYITTV